MFGIENYVGQEMWFTVIPEQISKYLARFQDLSGSTVCSVLEKELLGHEFNQELKILDKSIKRKIGDPITETDIDKFEFEMIP